MTWVSEKLAAEIRTAVTSAHVLWTATADKVSEAAVKAVRDHVPAELDRTMDCECYGVGCGVRPTWRVRRSPCEQDPTGGVWVGACGRHLNGVSDDITAGERMALDLERIRSDER